MDQCSLDNNNYSIITIDGKDFISSEGRLIPTISGGRSNLPPGGQQSQQPEEDEEDQQPTLADLMQVIQQQQRTIMQLQQGFEQQQGQFNELVDAIADAVQEDNTNTEEGEDIEEEGTQNVQQRNQQQQISQQSNEEVALLRRQLQKMTKQMEEMQGIISQREEQAEEERELRLASQRDALLAQALQEAGVLPTAMEAGMKLFRDDIAYDEERDEFVFVEERTGVRLPISEGIRDNMPDYLKATTAKTGGSGGRGSQPNAMLQSARENLAKLHERAKKSSSESDIAEYHAAKKQLMSLEAKISSSGDTAGTPAPQRGVTNPMAARRTAPAMAETGFNDSES